MALGEEAVAFLGAAAAAGTTPLPARKARSSLSATRTAPRPSRWRCGRRSSSAGSPPTTSALSSRPARPRRPRRAVPAAPRTTADRAVARGSDPDLVHYRTNPLRAVA